MAGGYEHEQIHVHGRITLVTAKVVDPLRATDGAFVSKPRCNSEAQDRARYYTSLLNRALDKGTDPHRDRQPGDVAYRNHPDYAVLYEPLPNSPEIPGN